MERVYDCIIIGAGIIGTSIAHALGRYRGSVLLLERGNDVALGATRANSGIVHGGYTSKAGTLKGKLAIRGNRLYEQLATDLGFPYQLPGSVVLALTEEEVSQLEALLDNGRQNGVEGLEILTGPEIRQREPLVSTAVRAALYCPETGIVSPYEAAIALAENAVENGIALQLNNTVTAIDYHSELFTVQTGGKQYTAPVLINAAGMFADHIAAMIGDTSFTIFPRKGEYLLLRRGSSSGINSVIFQTPTEKGKGVLVTPTTWGNLMIGPNSEDTEDREDTSNSFQALHDILRTARKSVPDLDPAKLIRIFSGTRPSSNRKDFIIGEGTLPGMIHVAGIDSPGLTSAPAIAEMVLGIMEQRGFLGEGKRAFIRFRKAITSPAPLRPFREVAPEIDLPTGDPNRVVCRCEQVTEATILDAAGRNIPINSLDAVKRRTRAGMGICQGAFCGPRVTELLTSSCHMQAEEIELPKGKDKELIDRLREC